jgi:hypothetical protein
MHSSFMEIMIAPYYPIDLYLFVALLSSIHPIAASHYLDYIHSIIISYHYLYRQLLHLTQYCLILF